MTVSVFFLGVVVLNRTLRIKNKGEMGEGGLSASALVVGFFKRSKLRGRNSCTVHGTIHVVVAKSRT